MGVRFLVLRALGDFPDRRTAEADANARFGPKGWVRVISEAEEFETAIERQIAAKNKQTRGRLEDDE